MKVLLRSAITILYFSSLFVFLHTTAFAQAPDIEWTKTFGDSGNDYGYSVQQTSDGGYIIIGSTQPHGDGPSDVWLIKTDTNGDTMWTKTFGDRHIDEGYSVQQTTDGGFIITGITNVVPGNFKYGGSDQGEVWLIKTSTNGDTIWSKTPAFPCGLLGSWGNSVQQTSDGGFFITGVSCGTFYTCPGGKYCGSSGDVLLIKTDVNGDYLWTKTYGYTSPQFSEDIGYYGKQTTDGGYIIAASTYDKVNDNRHEGWLIKTDAEGDTLWTKIFGDSLNDFCYSVQQTFDGGYIITGKTNSHVNIYYPSDAWLIKTDSTGNTLWTKTFGLSDVDEGHSIQQTNDGGYIILGSTYSESDDDTDVLLIKTNTYGDTMWTKTMGDSRWDLGYSVQQTSDGGYIVAGNVTEKSGLLDILLIKIAPDITSIDENPHVSVNDYQLQQNYPNPFNPSTTIKFTLPKSEFVELKVFNILGKEVTTIVSKKLNQGSHTYQFEGDNLASGIYYYQLVAGQYREVKKMILLR